MNQDRGRKLLAKKFNKQPVSEFKQIDLSKVGFLPFGMTRSFRNNRYVIMVFDNAKTTAGDAIQILIQKIDNTPILNHWAEIQKIKNEVFGKETTAIEYFPAESQLVDKYNIYWIWIYPPGVLPIPIV